MSKWTCNIGIEEKSVVMTVVACRGSMSVPPKGMVVTESSIDADERFMVVIKSLEGQWLVSCHAHEVIKREWDK